MRSFANSVARLMLSGLILLALQSACLAAPVVLFDQGHDQRFVVDREGPLQLTELAGVFRGEGLDVRTGTGPLSAASLEGVDALVISGPFAELSSEETGAVMEFVARGGRLALMLHIPMPVADLIHRLDTDFTNNVLSEQENVIEGDRRNFLVKNLAPNPLFGLIDSFGLYGGWALMNTGEKAAIIASTSDKGWVDLDGDGKLTPDDAVQSFGVIVEGSSGAGRYLIFGDDAIFQNKFLTGNNRQLAINLANWLR